MKKEVSFKDEYVDFDTKTLDFIARNILYPDRPRMNEKEVNLKNMMAHLGGTRAEIDLLTQVKSRIKNKNR